MGVFDSIEQALSKVCYGDTAALGAEPITYTPFAGGKPQAAIPLNVVIDRSEPIVSIPEAREARVRQVRFFLPRDPSGANGSPTCNRNDQVSAPWKVGDAPTNFRLTAIEQADAGGWSVVAEQSKT